MNYHGVIYVSTCCVNQKSYVGQTVNSSPDQYLQKHVRNALNGSNKLFHRAIRKYGPENFTFEIIWVAFDKESLDWAEDYFIIEEYKTLSPAGYNLRTGGSRGKLNEIGRAILRAAMRRPETKQRRKETDSRPEVIERRRQALILAQSLLDKEEQGRKIRESMTPERIARMQTPEVKERRYKTLARTNALPEVSARRSAAQVANQARPEVKILVSFNTRLALSDPRVRLQMRESHTGLRWINDGKITRQIKSDEICPEGWEYGRLEIDGKELRVEALLRGSHIRWHVNRDIISSSCRFCNLNDTGRG